MSTAMGDMTIVVVWALIVLFAAVLYILWVLMPFAVFGTKDLLRQLIREQRRTNELLQAQASRGGAFMSLRGALILRSRPVLSLRIGTHASPCCCSFR